MSKFTILHNTKFSNKKILQLLERECSVTKVFAKIIICQILCCQNLSHQHFVLHGTQAYRIIEVSENTGSEQETGKSIWLLFNSAFVHFI